MKLSIVLPFYNEETGISALINRLESSIVRLSMEYEVVAINDGSNDETLNSLKQWANENRRVRVIDLARNFGHQIAITAGLKNSTGDLVIVMDSDLQDPPELIAELIRVHTMTGADVVFAQRKTRDDNLFKRVTANLFYRALSSLSELSIPRNVGDFRLMTRRIVDEFNTMPEQERFVRGMISFLGFKQEPLSFDREARKFGSSSYPLRKMIKFAIDAFFGFSKLPLKIMNRAGVFFSILSFSILAYVLGVKIFYPSEVIEGWAFIMAGIFFLGGVQLTMLGILGEYIGRIFTQVQGRPLYVIREIYSSKKD